MRPMMPDLEIEIFKVKTDPETLKKISDLERRYNADFNRKYEMRRERALECEKSLGE